MFRNKKGISPLIATVLLVGFTIVLAVIVIGFVTRTTQNTTETTECQSAASNGCLAFAGADKITVNSATIGSTAVTITNLAPQPLDNVSVTVVNSAGATVAGGGPFFLAAKINLGQTSPNIAVPALVAGQKIRVVPLVYASAGGTSCTASCSDNLYEKVVA